jgi:hypothetical protein
VITKDYPLSAARAFLEIKLEESTSEDVPKKFTFVYLSGLGADQEERTSIMFGKVKGKLSF